MHRIARKKRSKTVTSPDNVNSTANASELIVNSLIDTLKPPSNKPLYSNTMIGTLAIDGWAVTCGTAKRGLGGLRPCPFPSSL